MLEKVGSWSQHSVPERCLLGGTSCFFFANEKASRRLGGAGLLLAWIWQLGASGLGCGCERAVGKLRISPAHPGGWTRLSTGDLRFENWGARARNSAGEASESGGTRSASRA